MVCEFFARVARKQAAEFAQAPGDLEIVGFAEQHAPEFGRAFDQLNVAFGINLFMQRREELDEVNPLDGVRRTQRAPGFLQRGGGGDVPAAGGDGRNQDAHGPA